MKLFTKGDKNSAMKLEGSQTPPLTPVDEDDSGRIFMREACTLPEVKTWAHRPLMVCVNSAACSKMNVSDHGLGMCPIGVPFKFSSELFEGSCLIRMRDSKSDNPKGDEAYFSGRKRLFQSVIQGRFKQSVPVLDVLTGQEFARPLQNLPHSVIIRAATALAGKIAPGIKIKLHCEQPYFEATLGSVCKVVRADKPGNEPDIMSVDIREDCTLFGGDFVTQGDSVSSKRRQKVFSNPGNSHQYVYSADNVYTFDFYEDKFSGPVYGLDLGFTTFQLESHLNGQPLQRMAKMRDGRYLWSFQMWHEKLLPQKAGDGKKSILLDH